MLQIIRNQAKGWLAWIIVIIIIIPFALWGIQEYLGGGGEVAVAEVNGVTIQKRQLEQAYYQQRQRIQQMMGENFRPEMFPEQRLKRQVLQQMVEREYMTQTVADQGYRIGDRQLGMEIRNIPAFQEDGSFSRENYEAFLRSQGFSPTTFEARLRRDLLAGQFQTGIVGSAFATEMERSQFARLQNQRRDIGYMTVPLERFRQKVQVTDDELKAHYEENRNRFRAPEQVKVAYVELSLKDISDGITVTEEQLKSLYEARKDNFRTPEERHARHILIEVDAGAGQQAEAEARTEAAEVLEKLQEGGSFAELAKAHSDDPGSAQQGGDLGFFGRGVMENAFEEAVYSMKVGAISDPVRTSFGYHIIKLEGIRGGDVKPFAAVKEQLRTELKRSRAEPQFFDQAEQLANISFEQPDTLAPVADALGLEVRESDWFSRDGGSEGIAAEQKVVKTAFGPDVLEAGNNSEPVELGSDRLVVVRIRDRRPERQLPLEEVKEDVRQAVAERKSRESAQQVASDAANRVKAGGDPEKVAKELGLEWKTASGATRNAADGTPPGVLQAGFAMPKPGQGSPSTRIVPLRGGDQAVVVLLSVDEPAPVDKAEDPSVGLLAESNGEAEFAASVEGISRRSEVHILEKNL